MKTAPILRGTTGSSLSRLLQITGLSLGLAASAHAQLVLMDQIGDGTAFPGTNAYASQIFEPANSAYNSAVVDDFSVSSAVSITRIDAVLLGWNGFSSFGNIRGYQVNLYSSLAAGQANLTGDVASVYVSAGDTTLTTPFAGQSLQGLVSLPVNIAVGGSGTYFLGVSSLLDYSPGGQVGVALVNSAPWGLPGGVNAMMINPSAGFGATITSPGAYDAAYRVLASTGGAVPEAGTTGAVAGAALLVLVALKFRRRN